MSNSGKMENRKDIKEIKNMEYDYASLVKEQKQYINRVLKKDKLRIPMLFCSGKLRGLKKQYSLHTESDNLQQEFNDLSDIIDGIDRNKWYRFWNKCLHELQDMLFERKYKNPIGRIRTEIKKTGKNYLVIASIVKNEGRYIREWVAYYKLMKVDHIYLFDNGSTDSIRDILKKEIKEGYVTLIPFRGVNAQLPMYRLTAKLLKNQCRWVAYIDADEFILPQKGTLRDYLKTKENYPGIGINWIVYGPSGHVDRPEGLVMENYLQTFQDRDNVLNLRIKTIANPKEIYDVSSPHYCTLKNSRYAVDEDGEEITTKWMYVSGSGAAFTGENKTKRIRINHYWTRSEQDLREKCDRGYAAGSFSPDYQNIMSRLAYPQMMDYAIEPYVAEVKRLLEEE